jgi:hypothetical protein
VRREDIEALRAKYEEMLRLRTLHGAPDEPDPRPDMARLAERFPGALREIDELAMDDIRGRIAALRAAEAAPDIAAPWMIAVAMFHDLTRSALHAKRWLARRRHVDDGVRAAFAEHAHAAAQAWARDLHRIARPPRGRITELVFARIAATLGVSVEEARRLVFGEKRRA